MKTISDLLKLNPCYDTKEFIGKHKTLKQLWDKCERADWMIWALTKSGLLKDKEAAQFAVRVGP